jgi:DNA primase
MLNSQTEEIKAKIDIVDLISEYTALKPAGTNWKARCPFHNEKTPSFMVSRDKQIWHCFGCGEGGDIFEFVQKIENLEFPEALRLLADKAGIKLKKVNAQETSQKTKLLDILRIAAEFFHLSLLKSQEGQIGRDYIAKRELKSEIVEDFKIGYAPDSWDKLLNFLIKKGYKQNDILLSGLVVKNDKGQLYDRFRLRLMFPIFDQHGAVVGFTGRILDEKKQDQGGKYVNTPQTMIYNKSLVIYGLDKAKNEIKKKDLVVIVEGNMDVVASHQVGITNVVASSGTALTQEQLKLLKRYTNNIALSFDADLAGQTAAERGIDIALALGFNIRVIQLPKEINKKAIKDPDDCIRQGAEHWQKAIESAVSIMDFFIEKIFSKYDKTNSEQRKEITNRLFKQIAKLPDKVEQDFWLGKIAQKLEVPDNILREAFAPFLDNKKQGVSEVLADNKKKESREDMLCDQFLALVLKYPQNLDYVISHLEVEMLPEPELQKIYREVILYYNESKEFDYSQFEKLLSDKEKDLVNLTSTLLLLADKDFFNFTDDQIERELINIIDALKKSFINKKMKQIQMLISQAEKEKNSQQIQELSKEFSALTSKLNNLL